MRGVTRRLKEVDGCSAGRECHLERGGWPRAALTGLERGAEATRPDETADGRCRAPGAVVGGRLRFISISQTTTSGSIDGLSRLEYIENQDVEPQGGSSFR